MAVLYGVTGTLNMADIAQKLPLVPASDRGLLHAGAAIWRSAFLAKAGLCLLNFWLPAYASAPAAAVFAVLTKVGVYAVLRLWTLCFPAGWVNRRVRGNVLVWGGLATLAFGSVGMLASQQLARWPGYSASPPHRHAARRDRLRPTLTGGALFYLASSTWRLRAVLLVELLERRAQVEVNRRSWMTATTRCPIPGRRAPAGINLDDNRRRSSAAPSRPLAFLGVAFTVCALVTAGCPRCRLRRQAGHAVGAAGAAVAASLDAVCAAGVGPVRRHRVDRAWGCATSGPPRTARAACA